MREGIQTVGQGTLDRATALQEMIGEYRDERTVEASRLDEYRMRRAKLELAREILVDHGEVAEANRLNMEIHNLDHHIQSSETTLARLDRLVSIFQQSLDKLREDSNRP